MANQHVTGEQGREPRRVSGAAPDAGARATPSPADASAPTGGGLRRKQAVELPEHFGRYRILKRLGGGGMGSVYLAADTQLKRQVALKVPHFDAHAGEEVRARFLREAQAAAQLTHPNICPLFDFGFVDGTPYLTMPYVEGKTLADFVRPDKRLAQTAVAGVVRKIALALDEAHRRGLVHRDLKPANVMINERKEPVVMDFGLARSFGADDSRITRSEAVVGTPAYMSPEQVSHQEVGPASDVYSLGVLLYELLTGELPFTGPVGVVFAQVLHSDPQPPRELRPDLDPELEAVCLKAMAKAPPDRFASMRELADALGQYLNGVRNRPGQAGPPRQTREAATPRKSATRAAETMVAVPESFADLTPAEPVPPRVATARTPRRPHWPLLVGIAAGLAALLVCGVVFLLRTPGGTIRVEVSDPNVTVAVDGQAIRIDGGPVPLKTGERRLAVLVNGVAVPVGQTVPVGIVNKKLVVRLGDKELTGNAFAIVRGDSKVLRIELFPVATAAEPQVTQTGTPDNATAGSLPQEITNSIGMKLTLIPAGSFVMGSPEGEAGRNANEQQHPVEITKPFYMGVYEVTQDEYRRVMNANPSYFATDGSGKDTVRGLDAGRFPVETVSWGDAVEFCRRLSDLPGEKGLGRVYGLPTEAEWEYACRGGAPEHQVFHFGDSLSSRQANFNGSAPYGGAPQGPSLGRPTAVDDKAYSPNGFGLYHMHGNVWEWCADWYDAGGSGTGGLSDPTPAGGATRRVLRGGAWPHDGLKCRTAYRGSGTLENRSVTGGFRVVCRPPTLTP